MFNTCVILSTCIYVVCTLISYIYNLGTQTVNIEQNEVGVQYDLQDIVEKSCNDELLEDDLSENESDTGDKEYDPMEDASQRVSDDSVQ